MLWSVGVLKSIEELLNALGVRGQLILIHVVILSEFGEVRGCFRLIVQGGLSNGLVALCLSLVFSRSVRGIPDQFDPPVSKPCGEKNTSTFFGEVITNLFL